MKGLFENVEIAGIAAAVPAKLKNRVICESIMDRKEYRKNMRATGVEQSYVSSSNQRTSDLCYAAAVKLLDHLKWDSHDIDVLIFVTQNADFDKPSTAFFLQKRLQVKEECLAYDINMGCSALNVGAYAVASHLSHMEQGAKGLLLIGDVVRDLNSERALHKDGVKHGMLFGSAGCAVAFQNLEQGGMRYFLKSRGEKFDTIIVHWGRPLEMDGLGLFDFCINDVSRDLKDFKEELEAAGEKIDFYVLHQGQKMIIDSLGSLCSFPKENILNSYQNFGNTNGSSIPVSICANRDRLDGMDKVGLFMSGFGIGLSWGGLYARISADNILPIIYTDECYDGYKAAMRKLWNKTVMFLGSEDTVCAGVMENFALPSISLQHGISVGETAPDTTGGRIMEHTRIVSHDSGKIVEKLVEESCKVNGIVVSLSQFSPEEIVSLVKEMKERDLFCGFNSSIVLLDGEWGDVRKKEALLDEMYSAISEESISVNMVMYRNDCVSYVKKLNRETEWVEEYVRRGFDCAMTRMTDITNIVYYFLSEDICFVNGSVIKVDERMEGGISI